MIEHSTQYHHGLISGPFLPSFFVEKKNNIQNNKKKRTNKLYSI